MSSIVLHIDSSQRGGESVSRMVSAAFVEAIKNTYQPEEIIYRDVSEGIEPIDPEWVQANFTPPDERSADQKARLAFSDKLVSEVRRADKIVIGAAMYNFTVSAPLKAWIDQTARIGELFNYTPDGPVGLLKNKQAYIAIATGGTRMSSENDFLTPYLTYVLNTFGIADIEYVAADGLMSSGPVVVGTAVEKAKSIIMQ